MPNDRYIGMTLDNRYEILDTVGTGGMAHVYRARDMQLGRLIAVKILKDEFSEDEEFRRRFRVESQTVAMLSHPNIVAVYDVSKSDDPEYMVMELLDGLTLKAYITRKGVLTWKETLHFSLQIAKALSHAHSMGIIHRDIKPQNVMVLRDGSVKVMDFGIARLMASPNTKKQESFGSVHYISPEQAKGIPVDARTDLYSLGVVMYEMLTGVLPYEGDSDVAIAVQHINSTPVPPTELNPDIPLGLQDITLRALIADPKRRYGSADAMVRDLEEFRRDPSARFFGEYDDVEVLDADGSDDPTRPVPVVTSLTSTTGNSIKPAPKRNTPRKSQGEMTREEYRESRRRASRVSVALGSGIVLLIIVVLFVTLLLPTISKWFSGEDVPMITIPRFVGQPYDSVQQSADYKELFTFYKADEQYSKDYAVGVIMAQNTAPGTQLPQKDTKIPISVTVSLGEQPPVVMPNYINQPYRDASNQFARMLDDLKLRIEVRIETKASDSVTKDFVISTTPAAGEALRDGMIVFITYSTGPETKFVMMPKLVGLSLDGARELIEEKNLVYDPAYVEFVEDDAPENTVIWQLQEPFIDVAEKTTIVLRVSSGPAPSPEPSPEPTPSPIIPSYPPIPSPDVTWTSPPPEETPPADPTDD
ncbi:MAG: Stk1 family PASTA domain-containing Ser/Thr kinase [Oscillospiraceae bacterium]|jgi:serine/threonine-protein kinase|nr:Stk1 family PASTA domain-containing Ser/Thr kinase [Oscillospiraceae bacterium]